MAHVLKWHHRLGVLTLLALLLWGLSGMLHPLMSRMQPRAAQPMPPALAVDRHDSPSLPSLLRQHGIASIQGVSLALVQGQPHYRVTVSPSGTADRSATQVQYLSVQEGKVLPDGERLHAIEQARHHTGRHDTPVTEAVRITAFDADYHPTNRLLPVWKVSFDTPDHLAVYIDTDQSRLATLVNDRKRWMTRWFRIGHNWSFASGWGGIAPWLMSLGLGLILFSALSGVWFFVRMGRSAPQRLARRPLARLHRVVATAVALSTVAFAGSGAFHLWMGERRDTWAPAPRVQAAVAVNELSEAAWQALPTGPWTRLHLLAQKGQVTWLTQDTDRRFSLHDARSPQAWPGGLEHWVGEMAQAFAPASQRVASVEWVTRFGDEYGFVNKRLPVLRVSMQDDPDQVAHFIEPTTGVLAARVDRWDRLEGQVFAWVHKWRFADAHKDVRDALQALFALLNVGVAGVGTWLFIQRLRR